MEESHRKGMLAAPRKSLDLLDLGDLETVNRDS